jgi:hypothetical protein
MMLAAALSIVFGAAGGPAASTQQLWLVVGASDASPAAIARKAKTLSQGRAGSMVFATRDCGDKKNVFGWAAEIATTPEAAQAALARTRSTIKDAYLKRCEVRPGTLLALKLPAVDPSVADVPEDAVNWSDEDRVSSATPLPDGRVAVVARYFVNDPNDSLEGRRQKLLLITTSNQKLTLMDPCLGAGSVSAKKGRLAFTCARESAADQDLHSTFVFDGDGKQLLEVQHCGKPKWVDDQTISCSEETIDAAGNLKLRPKRVRVP